jgi:hypothetical protein
MKTFTIAVLWASLLALVPAQALAARPDYTALAEQFRKPVIPPAQDGQYQLRRLGKKFLMVFEPTGAPVVVFDLSLTPVSTIEMILGGFGIGDLNLLHLIDLIKKAHHAAQEAAPVDGQTSSEPPMSDAQVQKMILSGTRGKAVDGDKLFQELRLQSGSRLPETGGFTLGDLQFPSAAAREKFLALFVPLMNAVDRAKFWQRSNIEDALKEFEFRRDGKSYQVVWNHKAPKRAANDPALPGIIMDYYDLTYDAEFKASLLQLGEQFSQLKTFGPIGIVADFVISQMVDGMIEREEIHEHQFIGLLEAMERFEFPTDEFPAELLESTLGVMYDNLLFTTVDSDTSQDYETIRVEQLTYQEKAKATIMAKLAKELPASDTVTLFGGNKFALVRDKGPGFKAIMSSALNPQWLFRYVAKNVDGKSMYAKYAEREAVMAASAVARALLPTNLFFTVGNTNVSIQIDPMTIEILIRSQMELEKALEGELSTLVDEALAGRTTLPLAQDELTYVRKSLRKAETNAYEIALEDEDGIIEANYELLKREIGGRLIPIPY